MSKEPKITYRVSYTHGYSRVQVLIFLSGYRRHKHKTGVETVKTGVETQVSQQLPETGVSTGKQLLSLGVSTVCLNTG